MAYLDATALFGHQSKAAVNGYSVQLCVENDQRSDGLGTPIGVIFHWTAGPYNQCWDGYHFNVAYDPAHSAAYVVQSVKMSHKGKHLWARNTGMVGISLCAMADNFPVKQPQIDTAAILAAEICAWKQIDPRGTLTLDEKKCDKNADTIWNTGDQITAPTVADHHWYAIRDGYEKWRWDVGSFYPELLKKTQENYDKLKAGKAQFQYKGLMVG